MKALITERKLKRKHVCLGTSSAERRVNLAAASSSNGSTNQRLDNVHYDQSSIFFTEAFSPAL
jgi:hypothetical protein